MMWPFSSNLKEDQLELIEFQIKKINGSAPTLSRDIVEKINSLELKVEAKKDSLRRKYYHFFRDLKEKAEKIIKDNNFFVDKMSDEKTEKLILKRFETANSAYSKIRKLHFIVEMTKNIILWLKTNEYNVSSFESKVNEQKSIFQENLRRESIA